MNDDDWILAVEARKRLGVRAQTLYAYVSRGHVQVRAHPDDSRRSLYHAADVDDLAKRKKRSRKRADIASTAIAWGEPVLGSAITTVRAGRFYYRGRDAVRLSGDQPLEAIARLLRGEEMAIDAPADRLAPTDHPDMKYRLHLTLANRAATAPPMLGSSDAQIAAEASLLLNLVADSVTGTVLSGPIHRRLATAWGADPDGITANLIRRMLVLVADHELNASTFAARVTASTGASLAVAVSSGLSALSGPRHGGMSAMVRRFATEAELHGVEETVRSRLQEGRLLPGFGHPLYPKGDIRATALIGSFEMPAILAELQAVAKDVAGVEPNIDFAMMAIATACSLPPEAPFALFATARAAGWIAHAIEQSRTGELIRPRARYIGLEPEDTGNE